jgi:dUTP pyrophosphatase
MKVKVKKLHPDAIIPSYATNGASGFDLIALESLVLEPGETKLVKTGLSMEIEQGYELQIRPRSGLSLKTNLRIANSPGTVDSDFRGEVCVIMTNCAYKRGALTNYERSRIAEYIAKGDRIAQGVICPVIKVDFEDVDLLDDTKRGKGGFGSTGLF